MYNALYFLFTLSLVAYYTVIAALYLLQSSANEFASGVRLLYTLVAVIFLIFYLFWESRHGCAFSYWFPLHGTRRVEARDWRFGVLIRLALSLVLIRLFAALLLLPGDQQCVLAARPTYDGMPLFSCISVRTFLLSSLATLLLVTALLFYATAPQYRVTRRSAAVDVYSAAT